jgi:hypothetical protein
MGSRLELQEILEETLGSEYVYFQPPDSIQMHYPCIVYSRDMGDTKFADDKPYHHTVQYQLIVIGRDPDSSILLEVAMLPQCLFIRHYVVNNLHHDVYNIYY